MSRPLIPGEDSWNDILDPRGVHNRTIVGYVSAIDSRNGVASVRYDGYPSDGRFTTIPWLWASFQPGQVAWGRYMPFQNDALKLSFDYDDTIHAVGYFTRAGKKGVADGRAGYTTIADSADQDNIPFFKELKSGEYDFMSVGGAYIKGDQDGRLFLAGGEAFMALDRNAFLFESEAQVYHLRSGPSSIRFGEVRRENPLTGIETNKGPWNPTAVGREFQVELKTAAGLLGVPVSRFAFGDLATDTALEIASTGAPRKFALDLYAAGAPFYTLSVDQIGSTYESSPTATMRNEDFPLAHYTSRYSSQSSDVLTTRTETVGLEYILSVLGGTATINASTSTAITSPLVLLGPRPIGGALNGTTYGNATYAAMLNYSKDLAALTETLTLKAVASGTDILAALALVTTYLTAELEAIKSATSLVVRI